MRIEKKGDSKEYWESQSIVCRHCKAQIYVELNDLVYESGSDDLRIFCGDCDKETYRVNINDIHPSNRHNTIWRSKVNREERSGWLRNCELYWIDLYYERPYTMIIQIGLIIATIVVTLKLISYT